MTLLIILIVVLAAAGAAYYWFFMRGKGGLSMPSSGTEEGGDMSSMPGMDSGTTPPSSDGGLDHGMDAGNEEDNNQN